MLEIQGDRVLVIDCVKRTMPVWMEIAALESYAEATGGELSEATGFATSDIDTLDADQRKVMYERYTMIAPILSFVAEDWGAGIPLVWRRIRELTNMRPQNFRACLPYVADYADEEMATQLNRI